MLANTNLMVLGSEMVVTPYEDAWEFEPNWRARIVDLMIADEFNIIHNYPPEVFNDEIVRSFYQREILLRSQQNNMGCNRKFHATDPMDRVHQQLTRLVRNPMSKFKYFADALLITDLSTAKCSSVLLGDGPLAFEVLKLYELLYFNIRHGGDRREKLGHLAEQHFVLENKLLGPNTTEPLYLKVLAHIGYHMLQQYMRSGITPGLEPFELVGDIALAKQFHRLVTDQLNSFDINQLMAHSMGYKKVRAETLKLEADTKLVKSGKSGNENVLHNMLSHLSPQMLSKVQTAAEQAAMNGMLPEKVQANRNISRTEVTDLGREKGFEAVNNVIQSSVELKKER